MANRASYGDIDLRRPIDTGTRNLRRSHLFGPIGMGPPQMNSLLPAIDPKAEIAKLPGYVLVEMRRVKLKLAIVRGSIVEAMPSAIGQNAPGWFEKWDKVPGRYDEKTNTVIIATSGKYRTGSKNMTLHEVAHGLDHFGHYSLSPELISARKQDLWKMDVYYRQYGERGQSECFAESFARFYGKDSTFRADWPHLHGYMGEFDRRLMAGKR